MCAPAIPGDGLLTLFDLRTQDEVLRLEDLRNRGVDIGLDGPVLRFEIE